jgi:hypothetical protein
MGCACSGLSKGGDYPCMGKAMASLVLPGSRQIRHSRLHTGYFREAKAQKEREKAQGKAGWLRCFADPPGFFCLRLFFARRRKPKPRRGGKACA